LWGGAVNRSKNERLLNGSIVIHPALIERCTFKSANPSLQTNVASLF
jgi:hypothetical protein